MSSDVATNGLGGFPTKPLMTRPAPLDVSKMLRGPSLSYGRMFARVFAQRTGYTLIVGNVGLLLLLLSLDIFGMKLLYDIHLYTIGFMRNVFHGRFWWRAVCTACSLSGLLVVRLRLHTRAPSSPSLLNRQGFELFSAALLFAGVFVWGQLALYRLSSLQALAYPEGRYGPPLLREQFLGTVVFICVSALIGAVYMAMQPAGSVVLFRQERLSVEQECRKALSRLCAALPALIAASLLGYAVSMAVAGPALLRASRMVLRQLMPIRPTFHAFRACMEPAALLQFAWCAAGLAVVWEGVGLVIGLLFANAFRIARRSESSSSSSLTCPLLLDGLQAPQRLVREQALFELHQILMKDPTGRQLIFTEFVGGVPASKLITEWLIAQAKAFNARLEGDLAILHAVQERVNALVHVPAEHSHSNGNAVATRPAPIRIFAPQRDTLLSGLLRRLFGRIHPEPDTDITAAAPSSSRSALPAVLALPPKRLFMDGERSNTQSERSAGRSTWQVGLIVRLSGNGIGRYAAGLLVQYYRTRAITSDGPDCSLASALRVIECLARLASVSYTEDKLGQVQFLLDALLNQLLATFQALLRLHNAPDLSPEAAPLLPEISITEAGDQAFHRLLRECAAAIDLVGETFAEAMDAQPGLLTPETRARFDSYQRLLASVQ